MTKIVVGVRTIKILWLRCIMRHPNSLSQKWTMSVRNDNTGVSRTVRMLNTNNYAQLIALMIGALSQTMTNTSGGAESLSANAFQSVGNQFDYATPNMFAQLGTGTTPPTRGDYNLETPIAGTTAIAFSYATGASSMSASAAISYTTAVSPSEVGLFMNLQNSSGSAFTTMIDHAVFNALPSGTAFTISATIELS